MSNAKQKVVEAGAWLRQERDRRGPDCSARLVATVATSLARRDGNEITIHQQQLADIESSSEDRGPSKLQWWWKYVEQALREEKVDEVINAARAAGWRSPISFAVNETETNNKAD